MTTFQMPAMQAVSVSGARWGYEYNVVDDLMSMRRWLSRIISPATIAPIGTTGGNPATGQPNLYIEPDEGEFLLPAVTIQLVEEGASTYSPGDRNVHKRGYWSQLQLVIKVYGDPATSIGGRADTLRLGTLVWRALNEGGEDGAAYRPQLYAFALHAKVARRMRLVRTSMSMALEDTDDQRRWFRAIHVRCMSPRKRPLSSPVIPVLTNINQRIA